MKNLERWAAREAREKPGVWGVIVAGTENKPRWIIYPTETLTINDLAILVSSHNAHVDGAGEKTVWCNSLVNSRLEPRIEIAIGNELVQMDVQHARQIHRHLLEAIEAAMSDATLAQFARDYICEGKTDEDAQRVVAQLLSMFRARRAAFEGPVLEVDEGRKI
jgi:hypothetical protein